MQRIFWENKFMRCFVQQFPLGHIHNFIAKVADFYKLIVNIFSFRI